MVTGIRSLCTGLGPALFGLLFQIAEVPLDDPAHHKLRLVNPGFTTPFPGAPFLVGTGFVMIALFVAMNAPDRIAKRSTPGKGEDSMELKDLNGSISLAPDSLGEA
jgi:hypothetical protein